MCEVKLVLVLDLLVMGLIDHEHFMFWCSIRLAEQKLTNILGFCRNQTLKTLKKNDMSEFLTTDEDFMILKT